MCGLPYDDDIDRLWGHFQKLASDLKIKSGLISINVHQGVVTKVDLSSTVRLDSDAAGSAPPLGAEAPEEAVLLAYVKEHMEELLRRKIGHFGYAIATVKKRRVKFLDLCVRLIRAGSADSNSVAGTR